MNNKLLTLNAIKYLEIRLGRIVPIEEIENRLLGKLTKKQIKEELENLSKKGKIVFLKKKYVQRISFWKRFVSRFK